MHEQWGIGNYEGTISFPLAFTNTCFAVTGTPNAERKGDNFLITSANRTSFHAQMYGSTGQVRWIAAGL